MRSLDGECPRSFCGRDLKRSFVCQMSRVRGYVSDDSDVLSIGRHNVCGSIILFHRLF